MPTIWESFMSYYSDRVAHVSPYTLITAFWFFDHKDNRKDSDKLMGKNTE
jgi:hypothetical protein